MSEVPNTEPISLRPIRSETTSRRSTMGQLTALVAQAISAGLTARFH